jgi:RimJ/RimL family protein N-acetyltransferase
MPGGLTVDSLMRRIESGPLTLVPQTRAHAEEMFAVLRDPAIYTYENAPPASVEWLRDRFERLESRQSADGAEQWLNWVIRLEGTGLIGYVQATVRPDRSAAIAYELASAHWGRGLARRATEAMLAELIERYAVTTLYAVAKVRNQRSLRLLGRLGFVAAGPDLCAMRGVEPDEAMMVRVVAAVEAPSRSPDTRECPHKE